MSAPDPAPTAVELRAVELLRSMPVGFIAWGADWRCTGVNPAGETLCGQSRDDLLGRVLWDVFPEVVGSNFETVYRRVAASGTSENIEIFYPEPLNKWLDIHVTGNGAGVAAYFLDVTARHDAVERERQIAQALLEASEARDVAAAYAASLSQVALSLTSVESVEELEVVVIGEGLTTLGVDGGAIISLDDDHSWRITVNAALGEQVRVAYANAPYESPLPACRTARTGQRLLLPTRASGLAFDPVMARVYDDTHRDGWAFFPLTVRGRTEGSLAVSWTHEHAPNASELDVLAAFAAQCAQALHRIRATRTERQAATEVRELAEALQRAMLTDPPQPYGLEVEVRYQTAQNVAEVGGDWYDAFQHPDGSTLVVIGDVTGHDSAAAAHMGQLRGLLRTLAYTTESLEPSTARHTDSAGDANPSALGGVLSALERTARGLRVETLATAILARLSPSVDSNEPGAYSVQWSNAGHPPPVLIEPNGTTRLLEVEKTDLLLGYDDNADRHDHSTVLSPGATLLLYTDGLVERRDAAIDDGIDDLTRHLGRLADADLSELCDQVLQRMTPHNGDDDIALIAVRVPVASTRIIASST